MNTLKHLSLIVLMLCSGTAFAHHPMDGQPLQTFLHGLLSGVGHPVLGYDHLFFIVAAGVLCIYAGVKWSGPLVLLAGVAAGVLLAMFGLPLTNGELLTALSLMLFGGLGMFGKKLPAGRVLGLLVVAGALHGWMYGQTLVAQESVSSAVLTGYLSGLMLVHYVIAVGSGSLLLGGIKAVGNTVDQSVVKPQLACALVTGVGITMTLDMLVSV